MFLILAVHDVLQILSVLILLHDLIDFHQLILADPSVQICDFFQASNLTMLMLLDSLYEVGGIHQALMCTCIQPSEALTQQFYIQGAVFQINTVQIGNFQFTTQTVSDSWQTRPHDYHRSTSQSHSSYSSDVLASPR